MKATHTNYMHPKHLRVETGEKHLRWSLGGGFEMTNAMCLSPSHSEYARLNKPGLPSFTKRDTTPATMRDYRPL